MIVKIVSAKELYPIRHEVLRPGKPISTTYYQKDNHVDTIHFAAYNQSVICSIATFYPEFFKPVSSEKFIDYVVWLRSQITEEKALERY